MAIGNHLVVLVTLLSLLVYFWTSLNVARARAKYDIKAPATTGNPAFDRVFRVHYNTLEQLVLFLPCLWLFFALIPGIWAGVIGILWPIGRVIFALGYYDAPEKRSPGFMISLIPSVILFLGACVGLVMNFMSGI